MTAVRRGPPRTTPAAQYYNTLHRRCPVVADDARSRTRRSRRLRSVAHAQRSRRRRRPESRRRHTEHSRSTQKRCRRLGRAASFGTKSSPRSSSGRLREGAKKKRVLLQPAATTYRPPPKSGARMGRKIAGERLLCDALSLGAAGGREKKTTKP